MPQGPRGSLVRAVFTSVGALLCVGAIGCTSLDKPGNTKQATNAKQQQPGQPYLPGTQPLPGQPGSGLATTKAGQPAYNQFGQYAPNGVQPAGGTMYPPPTGKNYAQPAGGASWPAPSVAPAGYPTQPANYNTAPNNYQGSTGAPSSAGFASVPPLGDPGLAPPNPPGAGPLSPASVAPPGTYAYNP